MKNRGKELFNKLYQDTQLTEAEYKELLELHTDKEIAEYGFELARKRQKETFGNEVYTRGLIEISNYCKNDCIYCGIRSCCESGYALGFRTFVLQGGEDGYYTDDLLEDLLHKIKAAYPDCAITLSLGERSRESYERLYTAGADRYLLRHETANEAHYGKLHPAEMSLKNRKQCLYTLKEIGYQVGCGIMVGSPYQTIDNLVEDLAFMKAFNPNMVGIGPFIPQKDTPFGEMEPGSLEMTLFLLAIIRLMLPKVLLPATTALGTIHSRGRELGILAGGNVVMPNLSPVKVRKKYALYDNKICTGEEAAECRGCLGNRMESIGYKLVVSRGDSPFI